MNTPRKTQYLNYVALELLEQLGVIQPTQLQIDLVELLLSKVTVAQRMSFDHLLTAKEISCLYWAAMGKTSTETARLLSVKRSTIESHRKEIKRKLACDNMAQAVFEGIRYGYMAPRIDLENK